jgi:hypothetical protein
MTDPHDLDAGGHAPIDVDPFVPTGICAMCAAADNPDPEHPDEGDN